MYKFHSLHFWYTLPSFDCLRGYWEILWFNWHVFHGLMTLSFFTCILCAVTDAEQRLKPSKVIYTYMYIHVLTWFLVIWRNFDPEKLIDLQGDNSVRNGFWFHCHSISKGVSVYRKADKQLWICLPWQNCLSLFWNFHLCLKQGEVSQFVKTFSQSYPLDWALHI